MPIAMSVWDGSAGRFLVTEDSSQIWQTAVAVICVVVAAGILVRRAVALFSPGPTKSACGHCTSCATDATGGRQPEFVSLSLEPLGAVSTGSETCHQSTEGVAPTA